MKKQTDQKLTGCFKRLVCLGVSPVPLNDDIQARVDELVSAPAAQAGVTIDRIIAELAKIGFSDVRRAAELSTGFMSAPSPTKG